MSNEALPKKIKGFHWKTHYQKDNNNNLKLNTYYKESSRDFPGLAPGLDFTFLVSVSVSEVLRLAIASPPQVECFFLN